MIDLTTLLVAVRAGLETWGLATVNASLIVEMALVAACVVLVRAWVGAVWVVVVPQMQGMGLVPM
ncbi:MAG: hypothetical protein WAZ18_06770, partial [Alphaproteobacteria bacterium]